MLIINETVKLAGSRRNSRIKLPSQKVTNPFKTQQVKRAVLKANATPVNVFRNQKSPTAGDLFPSDCTP